MGTEKDKQIVLEFAWQGHAAGRYRGAGCGQG